MSERVRRTADRPAPGGPDRAARLGPQPGALHRAARLGPAAFTTRACAPHGLGTGNSAAGRPPCRRAAAARA